MANRHNIYKSSRRGFFPGTPLVTRQGPRGASHGDNWRTITPTQSSLTGGLGRGRQRYQGEREAANTHLTIHLSLPRLPVVRLSERRLVSHLTDLTSHTYVLVIS